MGLETITPSSQPDELNNQWPAGADPKNQGDDHIRNIKTVLKNFYTSFTSWKGTIEGYFDGNKAKLAKNSQQLNGKDPDYYRDPANLIGKILPANLPTASTTAVGITSLSNDIDSDSETEAATPAAIKAAMDALAAGTGVGPLVQWTEIPIVGTVTSVAMPAAVKQLMAANNVEFRFIGKKAGVNSYYSTIITSWRSLYSTDSFYQSEEDYSGTGPTNVAWKFFCEGTSGGARLEVYDTQSTIGLENIMFLAYRKM